MEPASITQLKTIKLDIKGNCSENPKACFHGFNVGSATPCFKLLNKIGAGCFGNVYNGECSICNRNVAVKVIDESEDIMNSFIIEKEIRNLMHLKKNPSSNIVTFFGFIKDNLKTMFFFEIGQMTLDKFVSQKGLEFSIAEFNEILFQILSMLRYLNEVQIHHNDFVPDNMIVCIPEGNIKLIDFGISSLPEDDGFKNPLSDLKYASLILARLQLLMRYKTTKNTNYTLASKVFFGCVNKPYNIFNRRGESLLSTSSNWLSELPIATRELLIKAFSPDINEQHEVLITGNAVSPRKSLIE